jgi:GGDEF domain-containing protein
VIAELRQLDGVVERLGRQAADRIVSEIAHLMLTEGRSVDRMARLGDGRFGLLLLETDEIAARGYIDRLQAAADGWLESAGLSIRLSLGWAGATEAGDVASAAAAAYQRMAAVDRRPASEGGDI